MAALQGPGGLSSAAAPTCRNELSDPLRTLPRPVVAFEFSGTVYSVSDAQATLVAEALRGYAKGKLPEDEKRVAELSGNPHWSEGALAVADFTEEVLVGNLEEPIPLEGKAAEATFWTLRMMELDGSGEAAEACALRDALGIRFSALRS